MSRPKVSELARKYGMPEGSVRYRLEKGIPLDAPRISDKERLRRAAETRKRNALRKLRSPFACMVVRI